jgi:WD40 repeat protein
MKKKTIKISQEKSINCVLYSNKDRFIVTGDSNGSITLYNTLINQISSTLITNDAKKSQQNNSVTSIYYASNNTTNLVSGYDDGTVILWDLNKSCASFISKSHSSPCTSVVLSPLNDFFLVSGGLDSLITLHDTSSKEKLKSIQCAGGIASLDMLKNGSTLCVGTVNGMNLKIRIQIDLISNKLIIILNRYHTNV